MIRRVCASFAAFAICSIIMAATRSPVEVVTLTLKDHHFTPETIIVQSGKRVKIDFTNEDATADDFDSDDLHIDKDIGPHGRTAFFIGPLKPGTYAFKGELHGDTAHGTVVAKDAPIPPSK